MDSGADLLLVSSVFDRNGWNIGTLRDGRDVNELQDAGAVQTQGMSSVNIDSCVFELNLANYQLHVGQTAGDPPSFTLVDSSFTTDFARRCEELSPAYADQTAECVAVFQCESHQNDCDWTWLQSLGLSKLDQWCCMHDLGTETTCTASGGRCIANVQGDSYVGDRHAMLWNHNSKAGLVCPGDDSQCNCDERWETATQLGEPLPFREPLRYFNDAIALASQPIVNDNGLDCCSAFCRSCNENDCHDSHGTCASGSSTCQRCDTSC